MNWSNSRKYERSTNKSNSHRKKKEEEKSRTENVVPKTKSNRIQCMRWLAIVLLCHIAHTHTLQRNNHISTRRVYCTHFSYSSPAENVAVMVGGAGAGDDDRECVCVCVEVLLRRGFCGAAVSAVVEKLTARTKRERCTVCFVIITVYPMANTTVRSSMKCARYTHTHTVYGV